MSSPPPSPPPKPAPILIRLGRRWLGTRQIGHLMRFEPLLEIVRAAGAPGGTVLDVGSGSRGIAGLLGPAWRATAVDANFEDYVPGKRRPLGPDERIGDVRDLPFADASFDVVVAVDLLEHVAPNDRAIAVGEICRVSRRRAVIAGPAGEEALAADRRLAARFAREGRPVPGWLTEHLGNGFPETTGICTAAAPFGRVSVLGNESIPAHERMVAAEHRPLPALMLRLACRPTEWLMTARRERPRRLARALLRRLRGDDRAPAYRSVVVVEREMRSCGQ